MVPHQRTKLGVESKHAEKILLKKGKHAEMILSHIYMRRKYMANIIDTMNKTTDGRS